MPPTVPKPIAWVTGAAGLIGHYLISVAATPEATYAVRGLTRQKINLTDFTATKALFQKDKPSLIIHCAALTKTADCQANPKLARRVNVDATVFLAELAREIGFIFFSTDLVFDGKTGNYSEQARVNPLSVYAETKVAAENAVLSNPRHTVIRTSLNGGISLTSDRGFNELIRQAWGRKQPTRLFVDEYRSPIAAEVTARTVWALANQRAEGVFHVAGRERLSRFEIGTLLAARWPELEPRIEAETLKEYQGAPRAPDTSLNCSKAQALLSFQLPGLSEWLAAHPEEKF
jgi:dTDP-4-dehydrorhamnose reductase